MLNPSAPDPFRSVYPKPDWSRLGRDWPNREASQFVEAGGLRWHVQIMGEGPALLLLHGAGAATHSWRDLAPILSNSFKLIAPDLPGHGFTETPSGDGLSLPGMARNISALLDHLGASPIAVIGHSAGAAIGMRLGLADKNGPGGLISLNGALAPFPGMAGHIFPAMAKLLFLNPLAIRMFAWRGGRRDAVVRLIEGTGSRLDEAGLDAYARIMSAPGHVAGALGMMANWDLFALRGDMARVAFPLTLIVGEKDLAVPPRVADDVRRLIPQAEIVRLPGLGHLAHEEAPDRVAHLILKALAGKL
jgi:magnesium chelatase accessory protein